jgi:TRAP-type C4-dicarboxylate transport system permease small subunit
VDRQLQRAWPSIARAGRSAQTMGRLIGHRLRPVGALVFRGLALLERRLLRAAAASRRVATRVSAVLPPQRAICLAILASAACLIVAQFIDYRAVEIGQPGYAGLPAASAPTVGAETPGQAHTYLLVPVALLAAVLALAALRNERRRGLGRIVFALGLLSLAVILLVDLPAGLDAGAETSRFSAAKAVLYDGFYAQIAAAAGLMLGGMLLVVAPKVAARYHARPCRTRTNLFARGASALRRRRRRRASSRGKGARRGSRRRNGAVSAPASPR